MAQDELAIVPPGRFDDLELLGQPPSLPLIGPARLPADAAESLSWTGLMGVGGDAVLALPVQDEAMSHGGNLYRLSGEARPERNFDIALRGYRKDQVDSFIHNLETEITALAAERDHAFAQLHALAAQVNQMETELTELRRLGAHSPPPVPQAHAAGAGADD